MARTMQVMVLMRCPEARARNQLATRLNTTRSHGTSMTRPPRM
jgi:hypothetical protein